MASWTVIFYCVCLSLSLDVQYRSLNKAFFFAAVAPNKAVEIAWQGWNPEKGGGRHIQGWPLTTVAHPAY